MTINCPRCKIPMRNIERLGMGPKYSCNQCDLKLWQRDNEYFRVTNGYRDADGNIHNNVKKVKV